MALKEMINGGGWTEERHAAFLNCMEESFVQRMFNFNTESNDVACFSGTKCRRFIALGLEIPDSETESTSDSPIRKSCQVAETGNEELVTISNTNSRRKRQLSQLDTSQDQVVPQMGTSKKKRRA